MNHGLYAPLYNQPIVLDNGSSVIKTGFSGGNKPTTFEYNLVGKPKYDKIMNTGLPDDTYVGNIAQKHRGILKLRKPMSHGVIEHWDEMELIWSLIFETALQLNWKGNELEEHPLLITEAPLNPESNRERMCELLFETFNTDVLYVANPDVLSLYADGSTTGCVLNCSDGYCSSTPIYEGFALPSSIKRINLGGRDLTEQLQFYLRKTTGISLFTSSEQEIVRTIKEKACYVSLDYKADETLFRYTDLDDLMTSDDENIHTSNVTQFKLPDGQMITIGDGKYRIPEILFNPSIIHSELDDVPTMLLQSLGLIDIDLRPRLRSNIVLSGATTLFPGFGERLLNELETHSPVHNENDGNSKIRIVAPPKRKYTAWIGGSIFASSFAFQKLLLNKKSWYENPKLVHSRFM